jgi:CDP-paratose 2-epimerase
MPSILIRGTSGLIGSEAVSYFGSLGWITHGVDNNIRKVFFGPDGDTAPNLRRLLRTVPTFKHHELDIRDRQAVLDLFKIVQPDLVIHCAAQPSHDLASKLPFEDFDINAVGTLNLLEGARRFVRESPFIFMSTNKVYGDAPNEVPLVELKTPYDYARREDYDGVNERCRIDASLHSLFGVSKVAADLMVQEYGRYFGMPTVGFRGGCLTGGSHASAELHGFLAYLARAIREDRTYRIFGYGGKQVRDNIHAYDVCTAFHAFYENPRTAAVYNLGGGRANSVSVIEAIHTLEQRLEKPLTVEYVEQNRVGDHICYISDVRKFRNDYPEWTIMRTLDQIFDELARPPEVAE